MWKDKDVRWAHYWANADKIREANREYYYKSRGLPVPEKRTYKLRKAETLTAVMDAKIKQIEEKEKAIAAREAALAAKEAALAAKEAAISAQAPLKKPRAPKTPRVPPVAPVAAAAPSFSVTF